MKMQTAIIIGSILVLLIVTAVVVVRHPAFGRRMSEEYCALPHDGEYPLRRYLKRISVEI